jgi:Prolyl-tRNA synthetase, C-terminal
MKWEDFVPAVERGCMVMTPFCDEAEWEDKVKVNFTYSIVHVFIA